MKWNEMKWNEMKWNEINFIINKTVSEIEILETGVQYQINKFGQKFQIKWNIIIMTHWKTAIPVPVTIRGVLIIKS